MIRSQDLIKSVDAAEMLGITVDQLRKRVRDGHIFPVVRERNFMLFSREELSEYISEESPGTWVDSPGDRIGFESAQVFCVCMDRRITQDPEGSDDSVCCDLKASAEGSFKMESLVG